MSALIPFSDILTSLSNAWNSRNRDECVLSVAIPLKGLDPLLYMPIIAKDHSFRFVWELSPSTSFVAAGKSQHIDVTGPKRFELAQRFSDSIFGRLLDVTPSVPEIALPRILCVCSFFDQIAVRQNNNINPPLMQAVLPRWQLISYGDISYLRINGVALNESEARELVEQLWMLAAEISNFNQEDAPSHEQNLSSGLVSNGWQSSYEPVLSKGIDLVNSGVLKKLVLAVRQPILLDKILDPLTILLRLRDEQSQSCRFLWQENISESFFGASPERLLSFKESIVFSDALAGTSSVYNSQLNLLCSEKDRREHYFVVSSIVNQFLSQDLNPIFSKEPELVRYGNLFHLRTKISAKIICQGLKPFQLINALHPTPAVAGFPLEDAINWIHALEPFERGRYAAPIGWINSMGHAEFRVAIRCGNTFGNKLDLIAGSGLIKGSIAEKEIDEVALKLGVLADQFNLMNIT